MQSTESQKAVSSIVTEAIISEASGKKWYLSKTFWINVLVFGAITLQMQTGFIVTPELQTLALAGVNIALRKVTKEEIVW